MKIYTGTKEEVLAQMATEHKKSRQDMLNRKLVARLRKEAIENRQEETMVKFCAGKVGKYYFGRGL